MIIWPLHKTAILLQVFKIFVVGPCIPNFRVEFWVGTSKDEFGKSSKNSFRP